ncbi:BLUF domain-containing protein [Neptuniibacter caesariensis]|uniref:Activator of photopigment and puc expression n=1 Tax=Neptuniibacter caesariensis TaxID=207954 RepID=A0A7U8C994_NEPCE|nr:BLUF domain-containing protein [Neptuniibacter caesariensis]EAR62450.1 activator of photopigment and puc expression [Oceanospirillum sp. MED92] [Neptuniibacter caesariensis]
MYRLIYKSRPNGTMDWEQVRTILHQSEQNNEQHGITGLLLATPNHFLQVIEGKYEEVNKLFMKIAHDPRHGQIQLISFDLIDSRLFAGWGMKGLGLFDFNNEQAKLLKTKYGESNGDIQFPLDSWQALALINDLQMLQAPPEWKQAQ